MIAVNIETPTRLCKLFLPDFIDRASGRILNVSSTAAIMPGPLQAVYYATKAYVTSWSNALWRELKGTGVTVTVLMPGAMQTGFANAGGLFRHEAVRERRRPHGDRPGGVRRHDCRQAQRDGGSSRLAEADDGPGPDVPQEGDAGLRVRPANRRVGEEGVNGGVGKYVLDRRYGSHLEMFGINVGEALREAGAPEDLFSRHRPTLEEAAYYRFMDAIGSQAKDPQLPIRIASADGVESFSPPLFAAYCSENAKTCCERLSEYKRIIAPMRDTGQHRPNAPSRWKWRQAVLDSPSRNSWWNRKWYSSSTSSAPPPGRSSTPSKST